MKVFILEDSNELLLRMVRSLEVVKVLECYM